MSVKKKDLIEIDTYLASLFGSVEKNQIFLIIKTYRNKKSILKSKTKNAKYASLFSDTSRKKVKFWPFVGIFYNN